MPTTALTSEPSTVTVTGTATATTVPDIVRLTIGVSVTQTAVSDAFDAVARLSTALTEDPARARCARSGPHHRRAERPSADSLE
nr:SIMPL domain-containing protein [Rhodococcus erythropolis]